MSIAPQTEGFFPSSVRSAMSKRGKDMPLLPELWLTPKRFSIDMSRLWRWSRITVQPSHGLPKVLVAPSCSARCPQRRSGWTWTRCAEDSARYNDGEVHDTL